MKAIKFFLVVLFFQSCNILFSQITNSSLNPIGDAQVYCPSQTTPNGSTTTTYLSVPTTTDAYRYYTNFNIGSLGIPSNAIITSATLSLTPNGSETGVTSSSFVLQTVTSSWDESTIIGTPAGRPTETTVNQVVTSSYGSGKRSFNVTLLVQNIVKGATVNYGWFIRRNPETTVTTAIQYHTKETANSANKPQLAISWYVPMTVSSANIVHCSTTSSQDGSISPVLVGGSYGFTYQWYTSNGSAIAAPSGTSLNLNGRTYGWYGLKVTGSAGDVFYMSFILGVRCQDVTINYNPDKNYIDDAILSSNSPSTNNGTGNEIAANKSTKLTLWHTQKSLLKFRLWMDNNLTISQANLQLYGKAHVYVSNSNASYLKKVTTSWEENTVTWNTIPSSISTNQISLPWSTSTTQNYLTLNSIPFWNDWKSNNSSNYGMLLELQSTANVSAKMSFHSSDTTLSSIRPAISFIFRATDLTAGTITPGQSSVCSGSTTLLTLTGYSPLSTFQWQSSTNNISFVSISGATNSTYTTLSSTTVDTYYRCVVMLNGCSSQNSHSQLIIIKPIPSVTVSDAVFCSGDAIQLTGVPSLTGGTYLWNNGMTTNPISVSPLVNTSYSVVYTLNGCSSAPDYANVQVCQQYAKLERELTGINYKDFASHVNFFYDQEYTSSSAYLNYKIYNVQNRTSSVMSSSTNAQPLSFGDNRYKLNVSSLNAGAYILEIENDKSEKFYLRFIKQ